MQLETAEPEAPLNTSGVGRHVQWLGQAGFLGVQTTAQAGSWAAWVVLSRAGGKRCCPCFVHFVVWLCSKPGQERSC